MNLIGFYLGMHDSSVCASIDGVIRYRKFERNSGIKHQRAALKDVIKAVESWGVQPQYVAYTDGNRNGLGCCGIDQLFAEAGNVLGASSVQKTFCLDHHFAHALSTWPLGPVPDRALAIAMDGRGDNGLRVRALQLGLGPDAKQLYRSSEFILGRFFSRVGASMRLAGEEIDFPGKVMGAQAYGLIDTEFVASLADQEPDLLPRRLLEEIPWRGALPAEQPRFFDFGNPNFLDWLASCHQVLSDALVRLFRTLGANNGPVLYTGGCAQNSVFNEALIQQFPGLLIPPSAYDGGLSLGCVDFLRRWLGLPDFNVSDFPFIQDDDDAGYAGEETIRRVARLIERGKIVGWVQGRGEIGPRALGHRSILVDPRLSNAKNILNDRVKRREQWRPYAASVLEHKAVDWFKLRSPSPYMLRAITVRDDQARLIPAVVHCDGTCRVQTVGGTPYVLASFRALLEEFEGLTGLPLVLNTSLNSGGEPIHGSASQSIRLLTESRIDALCIGDRVLMRNP